MMKQNRRDWIKKTGLTIAGLGFTQLGTFALPISNFFKSKPLNRTDSMKLGAFSISLSVKDINTSKKFYENLGFKVFAGDIKRNYLIMKSGNSLIGLFQGMLEKNILTFNPGWDENAGKVESFDDVREIQKQLKARGTSSGFLNRIQALPISNFLEEYSFHSS